MIACISPGQNSADHSINTLRYADRLKEKSTNDYEGMGRAQQAEEKGAAKAVEELKGNPEPRPKKEIPDQAKKDPRHEEDKKAKPAKMNDSEDDEDTNEPGAGKGEKEEEQSTPPPTQE